MQIIPHPFDVKELRNLICISDTHLGCQHGLCDAEGMPLDGGGTYQPSRLQLKVFSYWEEFWGDWVPRVTQGEPYGVVLNGDALENRHHGSTSQASQNLSDQHSLAVRILKPIVAACDGRYWHVRGTEAHSGPSGEDEERLARELGAVPNAEGNYARFELWKWLGGEGLGLVHAIHHIGTTGSSHHEASAVNAELSAEYVEAARWNERRPDCVVRSHRHRHIEVRIPTDRGYGYSLVTAGWQLKTPFSMRIAGGRIAPPQFGGTLVRYGDEDGIYTRHYTKHIERGGAE